MDSPKPGAKRGRGTILFEIFKKQEAEKEAARARGPGGSGDPIPIVGRGRAALLKKVQAQKEARVGIEAARKPTVLETLAAAKAEAPKAPLPVQEVAQAVEQLAIDAPADPVSYQGSAGRLIRASANYISLDVDPERGLYEYEVRFDPDVDARSNRVRLLNEALGESAENKVYDGNSCLYLPSQLYSGVQSFESAQPTSGEVVRTILIYKRKKKLFESLHFYNVIFKRIMYVLMFKKMGKNYFNPNRKQMIPNQKLEVYPGYAVSVDEREGGLMVCLDTQHRLIRTQTVYELLEEVAHANPADFQNTARKMIIGSIVLTRYNHETYVIDDIVWDATPKDTFEEHRTGKIVSYVDYYKKQHNISIADHDQPLLVNRRKKAVNGVETDQLIGLIPELCNITGLTDMMRSDFKVMKDIAAYTRVTPNQRINALRIYLESIQESSKCQRILSAWGLRISPQPLKLAARALPDETIYFKKSEEKVNNFGEWNKIATAGEALTSIDIIHWQLYFTPKDRTIAANFVELVKRSAKTLGCRIGDPEMIVLASDRSDEYMRAIERHVAPKQAVLQATVFIVPSIRADRYTIIKKLCCCQYPNASQVILSRTLSNPAKTRTIVHKILMQITCKLGGTLWKVKIPFANWMVVGIDVYHGAGSSSVCGFVASLNSELTTWFSEVAFQKGEMGDFYKTTFYKALSNYQRDNGTLPDKVIIFRDGVGDGQLEHCRTYELPQFEAILKEAKAGAQITFVVVQKRISTRIYEMRGTGAENPPNGTVVDNVITKRNYRDFFLIPQSVRQGTVNPTHYIVVHDGNQIKADYLQRLAYKLCHLYYNWSGIIKVPAPCLYAHKLAALVGMHLKTAPSAQLSQKLYYL